MTQRGRQRSPRRQVADNGRHIPDVDGFAATQAIRTHEQTGRRAPIVAPTASAAADVARCVDAGMDDCPAKPVRPDDLAAALARSRPAGSAALDGVLDPDLTDGLRVLARRGGVAALREIVDRFAADATRRIDAMAAAHAARDLDRVRALAHSLKGSSATVGARRVAVRCDVIERGEGRVEDVHALADELARAVKALRDIF